MAGSQKKKNFNFNSLNPRKQKRKINFWQQNSNDDETTTIKTMMKFDKIWTTESVTM